MPARGGVEEFDIVHNLIICTGMISIIRIIDVFCGLTMPSPENLNYYLSV
jgi:hypothetical protein